MTNELPINKLSNQITPEDRKVLESAGFVFDPVPGYDKFVYVTLPEGWREFYMGWGMDGMYYSILDSMDRVRAVKSCDINHSGDLSVKLCAIRRFYVFTDYRLLRRKQRIVRLVANFDGDDRVFTTSEYPYRVEDHGDYVTQFDAASEEAYAWLNKNYPNWEDPSAYWD